MARSACFVPVLSTKRVSFMDTGLSINNILRTQRDQMETAFFNVFDTFTYECGEKYVKVKSHTRVVNDKVVKVRFIK